MVVSLYQLKLFFICTNLFSNLLHGSKIHHSTCHRCKLACRNCSFHNRGVTAGLYHKGMSLYISAVMAVQIEIGVICQIEHCLLITYTMVGQFQRIIFIQSIGNLYLFISREAHVTVCVLQREGHAIFKNLCIPHYLVIALFEVAMQIIRPVIYIQVILLTINFKAGTTDTIRIGSHYHAEKAAIVIIIFSFVKSQYYILYRTFPVRHHKLYKGSAD